MGTVELTSAACTVDRAFGRPRDPVPGFGLTSGNSCDGLTGETLVPGIGGSETSGGTAPDDDVALLVAATTSESDTESGSALAVAETAAVNATLAPSGAVVETGTETSSSYTWPSGRLAILQVAPLADGQMAKLGVVR